VEAPRFSVVNSCPKKDWGFSPGFECSDVMEAGWAQARPNLDVEGGQLS